MALPPLLLLVRGKGGPHAVADRCSVFARVVASLAGGAAVTTHARLSKPTAKPTVASGVEAAVDNARVGEPLPPSPAAAKLEAPPLPPATGAHRLVSSDCGMGSAEAAWFWPLAMPTSRDIMSSSRSFTAFRSPDTVPTSVARVHRMPDWCDSAVEKQSKTGR